MKLPRNIFGRFLNEELTKKVNLLGFDADDDFRVVERCMLWRFDSDFKFGKNILSHLKVFCKNLIEDCDGDSPVAHNWMLGQQKLARKNALGRESAAPLFHSVIFPILSRIQEC